MYIRTTVMPIPTPVIEAYVKRMQSGTPAQDRCLSKRIVALTAAGAFGFATFSQPDLALQPQGVSVYSRYCSAPTTLRDHALRVTLLHSQPIMRLLDVRMRTLAEFMDERSALPYGILSHTWAAEEVSFVEMKDPYSQAKRSKAGFGKIDFVCRKAQARSSL